MNPATSSGSGIAENGARFARVGEPGAERPVAVGPDGLMRDLSGVADGIRADDIGRLQEIDLAALPVIEGEQRFGVPVDGVSKVIAIGLNYRDHARESNLPVPEEPVIFMKAINCLCGANDAVYLPRGFTMMDWEVELGVVIGARARYVERADALDCVAGYVLFNDLSERRDQIQRGGTWDKGKSHDGFGPVGPWLVTRAALGDASALPLTTRVNGTAMQQGSTADMIFDVPFIVSYVSQFLTLEPGDIIATGTPAGVGMGQRPDPIFLKVDDLVELDGGPLGAQATRILPSR